MAKKQFMLYPDDSLVARMDELAEKYGRKSGNVVAVEILETYWEFWDAAEAAKHAMVEEQLRQLKQPPSDTKILPRRQGTRRSG